MSDHPGRALQIKHLGGASNSNGNEPSAGLRAELKEMKSAFKAIAKLSADVLEAEAKEDPDPAGAQKRRELVNAWKKNDCLDPVQAASLRQSDLKSMRKGEGASIHTPEGMGTRLSLQEVRHEQSRGPYRFSVAPKQLRRNFASDFRLLNLALSKENVGHPVKRITNSQHAAWPRAIESE
ncbi:hypothetical protein THAOC_25049 [Thalassiosira oceanica]|uniref:Uncharacterized protein n=1 Tax=Thalassiosira oceanica TaxID=159749 RepID=K0S936_THAOC|nr:hypothetical protein THAOC_25049 [Thalassiosira oceanica]|eukprot:EJK55237.1 hypothetical protein THAOC_25049 [Thalassiosira oceanica]